MHARTNTHAHTLAFHHFVGKLKKMTSHFELWNNPLCGVPTQVEALSSGILDFYVWTPPAMQRAHGLSQPSYIQPTLVCEVPKGMGGEQPASPMDLTVALALVLLAQLVVLGLLVAWCWQGGGARVVALARSSPGLLAAWCRSCLAPQPTYWWSDSGSRSVSSDGPRYVELIDSGSSGDDNRSGSSLSGALYSTPTGTLTGTLSSNSDGTTYVEPIASGSGGDDNRPESSLSGALSSLTGTLTGTLTGSLSSKSAPQTTQWRDSRAQIMVLDHELRIVLWSRGMTEATAGYAPTLGDGIWTLPFPEEVQRTRMVSQLKKVLRGAGKVDALLPAHQAMNEVVISTPNVAMHIVPFDRELVFSLVARPMLEPAGLPGFETDPTGPMFANEAGYGESYPAVPPPPCHLILMIQDRVEPGLESLMWAGSDTTSELTSESSSSILIDGKASQSSGSASGPVTRGTHDSTSESSGAAEVKFLLANRDSPVNTSSAHFKALDNREGGQMQARASLDAEKVLKSVPWVQPHPTAR